MQHRTLVPIFTLTIAVGLAGCPSANDGTKPSQAKKSQVKTDGAKTSEAPPAAGADALMDPSRATAQAPATYAVKFETTKGDVIIDVTRAWAPKGADRFYNLVKAGFYDDVAFFRVISGFMAQVGISGRPKINTVWRQARIQDDPVEQSNTPGMVTFATAGPDTRTTQIFINYGNNGRLDSMGFAPFGKVRDMAPVEALYSGYGEGAPRGRGPAQDRLQAEGNAYLRAEFDKLDYIKTATILE